MSTNSEDKINCARQFSLKGHHQRALKLFELILSSGDSANPILLMEAGFAFDRAGHENKAVTLYKKALLTNISDENRLHICFCLASSYRNLGQSHRAVEVLRDAARRFPEEALFQTLRALVEQDRGNSRLAISVLLTVIHDCVSQKTLDPYRWLLKREARRLTRSPRPGASV